MRNLLSFLFLLFPLLGHADVLEGVVVDDATGELLPGATVKMEQRNQWGSSTARQMPTDSLGHYSLSVSWDGRLVITVSMLGYHPVRKMLYAYGRDSHDTIQVDTLRLRPTELMLQEVVVGGKMKRFTMSGDTIVFHPEAFKLEENARLEELIRKLPGVENRDGKLYFNGKPIRLVMNGHDVFGGSSDMLGQLPAVAADKLKVYDKKSDLERRSGNDDGEEDQVLDIVIKKSFLDKWYGSAEGGYATKKRYKGTLRATRLSDNDPVLVFSNVNNTNEYMRGGMNWMSWGRIDQYGKQQFGNVSYQHNWRPEWLNEWERNEYDIGAQFVHSDGWGDSRTSGQTFLPGEASTWSLSRSGHGKHSLSPSLSLHLWERTDSLNHFTVRADVGYERSGNSSSSLSAQTDASPFEHGSFPLDILHEAQPGDSLYRHLVNRDRSHSTSDTDKFSGNLNFSWTHNLGKKSDLTTEARLSYNHSVGRDHTSRTVDYVREQATSRLFQYGRTPGHQLSMYVSEKFSSWLSGKVKIDASYTLSYGDKHDRRDFYTATDEMLLRDSLDAVRDAANSYSSKQRDLGSRATIGGTVNMGKLSLRPTLSWTWLHERMDYRRGRLDTAATRNSHLFNPQVKLSWKIDRSQGLDASFRYSTEQPNLLSTLAYRDDANPLFVNEGNPALHRSHNHQTDISFHKMLVRQQMDYSLSLSYSKRINPVTTMLRYTPATGAYRSRQENTRGGDSWNLRFYFYKDIGAFFHVKNNLYTTLSTVYGHLTAVSDGEEASLNRTRTFQVREQPEFGIEIAWLEASVYGDISFARYRYSKAPASNSSPIDYTYGLRAKVTWKRWTLNTDIADQAHAGYLSGGYNGHHAIWQAEASCKVLKNKGKITLKMNDILNQDNRYNVSYGGNQRSETWQGHLHHYAEIGFSYTFDAKGK